ncbi:hypothetical protein APSETT445_004847 [Aspergillus pseudonomiae]
MSEVENQMRPRIAQVRSMCTKECCMYLCSGAYDKGFSTSIRNQEQRTTEAKDIRITRIVGLAASLNDSDTDRTTYTIDPRQLDQGLKILDFLADNAQLVSGLVRKVYVFGRSPIVPEVLMLPALDMLWDTFGDYMTQDEPSRLGTVVRVFENSYQQVPRKFAMHAGELSHWISGKNVRWETIGSVIQIAIMGLIYMPERDVTQIDPQQRSKDESLAQMLEVIDQLLPLSNALPVVNQLMVCLKYYQMMLASQRFGDSSMELNILQSLQSIWDTCPSHMKYSPDMWYEQMPSQDIIALLSVYLDYLHSIFLLHRFATQECQNEKPKELLLVAKTILSTVLVINEHRERAREFLPYGLPSAELLATELLQSSNPLLGRPTYPGLPRAEVIRELTLYISCLSWVARPGSGNLGFCKKVKAKLTRILDQILDPSYVAPDSSGNHGGSSSDVSWAFPELLDSDFTINSLLHSDDGSNWDPGFDLFCGPGF